MNSEITTAILALLTLVNYRVGHRHSLYPPLVFSSVWCLDAFVYSLRTIEVDEVHALTWWGVVAGAVCFSFGGLLTAHVPSTTLKTRIRELSHPTVSGFGRSVLVVLSVLAVPVMIRHVLQVAGGGPLLGTLVRARIFYTRAATAGAPVDSLTSNIPLFTVWVAVICAIERRDVLFWLAAVASLFCSILTTGRTYSLMLISGVAVVFIFKRAKQSVSATLRVVMLPFLLFVLLFTGLVFVSKDVSNFESNTGEILSNYVLAYVVTPIAALDYVVMHPGAYVHAAHHTFGFVSKFFVLIGLSADVPSVTDAYVHVPWPTNVYTVYKFLFTDFGWVGLLISISLIGFLQTFIYKRALSGGRFSLFMTALLMYPLLLSIFDDAYTGSGLFSLIKAAAVGVVYFGFLNRLQLGLQIPQLSLGLQLPRRDRA